MGVGKMRQVGFLWVTPGRLFAGLVGRTVGATLDDVGDAGAKLGAQPVGIFQATVLDDVVQQAGDRLVLVAAVVQHQRTDADQ